MLVIGYDAGNAQSLIPIKDKDFWCTGHSLPYKIYASKGFFCYTGASVGQNAASVAMTYSLFIQLAEHDGDWIKSLEAVASSDVFKRYGVTPYWETYPITRYLNPQ